MKNKFYLFVIASVLCLVFALAGCGLQKFSANPNPDDVIIGNGGMAVVKGDYLYFVNAFSSSSNISINDNKYGSEKTAGVYRVKLNNKGLVDLDEDGFSADAELMVPMICGFEETNLYIFDNYLYYMTPYTSREGTTEDITGLLKFEMVNLDNSGHKTVYRTGTSYSDGYSYKVCRYNGKIHLLLTDGKTLKVVTVTGSSVSEKVLIEDATNIVVPNEIEIINENAAYAYYTRTSSLEKDGIVGAQVVDRIKIDGNSGAENVIFDEFNSYTLKEVKNGRLYYLVDNRLYSSDFSGEPTQYGYLIGNTDYVSAYYIIDDQNDTDRGVVALFGSNLVLYSSDATTKVVVENVGSIKILYVLGENVCYVGTDNKVYIKNIFSTNSSNVVVNSINTDVNEKTYLDYDAKYIFYYDKVESSNSVFYYLNMIKINNGYTNEDNQPISQFIGVLDSKDVVKDTSSSN